MSTNVMARAALGVAGMALTIVVAQSAQAAPPPHAPARGYRAKQKTNSSHHKSLNKSGDIDRDGIPNGRDKDMDGDGILNAKDPYPTTPRRGAQKGQPQRTVAKKPGFMKQLKNQFNPGDKSKKSARTGDIDKDGIANRKDKDIDGDGIRNKKDKDRDGDHVANKKDDFDRRKNKK